MAAPAPEGQLGRRAATGSAWVTAGYAAGQLVRFGSNVVLTRLLFPKAFGLMLLVNVFLQALQLFSDLGIGASIIQHQRADRSFVDTAWTLQVLRGALLWLAALAVAWPAAALYGEPQLVWMLVVAGASAFIEGFVSTEVHTANRDLRMARLQVFELSVQVTAAVVMIAGAWLTRSVWALVAGMLAASLARAALSHAFLARHRNRFRWEPEAARSLLHFGKWVFASSIVTFLAQQGDRLIFGKMLPMARLGVYNIASTLCDAPSSVVGAISFKIFFPTFAELRRTSQDVDGAYRKASSALGLIAGAGALALVIGGPWLIDLLYDERYAEASWIVRLLALGIWGNSIVHFTASVVLASGRVKWLALANAARLLWVAALVPLGFYRGGLEVALVALAFADLPRYVALGLALRAEGLHVFRSDGLRTAVFGAAALAGLLVLRALASPGLPAVLAAGVVSLAIWLAGNRTAARWYLAKVQAIVAARRAAAGA